jgi:SAM-dependent methyltransferase
MSHETRGLEPRADDDWVGWCCPYCGTPLVPWGSGLFCEAEGRWLATQGGVHRLLSDERREDLRPFIELSRRVGREPAAIRTLGAPLRRQLDAAVALASARIGGGPWTVLEVGAGCAWAGVRLARAGHRVVAVDVDLDPRDGLAAAERVGAAGRFARAEADMEALPVEARRFDVVLAVAALPGWGRLDRVLVELRRVTRRRGLLVAFGSPVYRRREDGEAVVARAMRSLSQRFGVAVPRESQPGYLVRDELRGLFAGSGWALEVLGWPGRLREAVEDVLAAVRSGRRASRYPLLLARRDG